MRDLPLNGRGALALTLLTTGMVSNAGPTNSGFGDRSIQISSISINGSPSSMNAQMLDGSNNILSYVGEVGVPPAVDAVEEFKVQSGSMSAEFGFTAGGTVNLVTKSGTNQFHGTVYEFLRNDRFDARNTFAPVKLPFRYDQYGASIGGPVRKKQPEGLVHRFGIFEGLCNVGVQEHHVGTSSVLLVVRSAYTSRKIIFGSEVVVASGIVL